MLYKFTNPVTSDPIYINIAPENIKAIYSATANTPLYAINYTNTSAVLKGTFIVGNNGSFLVEEHISEVLAILEGRDPNPSKVLFGKRT